MLCALILYVSGGTYNLTATPNDRFLRNSFMAGLFTLRAFARNLLRANRQRNIFQAFASNKPTQYILDHRDFQIVISYLNNIGISYTISFMYTLMIKSSNKKYFPTVFNIKLILQHFLIYFLSSLCKLFTRLSRT